MKLTCHHKLMIAIAIVFIILFVSYKCQCGTEAYENPVEYIRGKPQTVLFVGDSCVNCSKAKDQFDRVTRDYPFPTRVVDTDFGIVPRIEFYDGANVHTYDKSWSEKRVREWLFGLRNKGRGVYNKNSAAR